MRVIDPYFVIESEIDACKILLNIEKIARVSYKSEEKMTEQPNKKFLKMLIEKEHLSVFEHEYISVRFICDRGVSHEIVRHRIGSYTQESTRYCNYFKDKFGKSITFIKPFFFKEGSLEYDIWYNTMQEIEKAYFKLIELGRTPQEARAVLPNSLKTEIIVTYNLRSWRHFFQLRCDKRAHPQMRQLAIPLLEEFKKRLPIVFDDLDYNL